MAKQSLRIGLIGCGYQGQWLARAAAEIPTLDIVACADPDRHAVQRAAAFTASAEFYATAEDLIRQAPIDAVLIATPHHLLQPYTLLAINAGKHVLTEKPVGLNGAQTAQIADAVAKTGVTMMAGYSFRYFPEPSRAQQLLRAGAIGQIHCISAGIGLAPMRGNWQTDLRSGGGPLLFIGVHLIDHILWYMADQPVEVYADVRVHPETGVDETSSFQIRFQSGATAQCLISDAADSWFYYLHLIGSAGKLDLSFSTFPHFSLTVQEAGGEPKSVSTPGDRDSLILAKMKAEVNDFADAVYQGRQPSITVRDAHAVLEVLDAVAASAASRQPVRLPDKGR